MYYSTARTENKNKEYFPFLYVHLFAVQRGTLKRGVEYLPQT